MQPKAHIYLHPHPEKWLCRRFKNHKVSFTKKNRDHLPIKTVTALAYEDFIYYFWWMSFGFLDFFLGFLFCRSLSFQVSYVFRFFNLLLCYLWITNPIMTKKRKKEKGFPTTMN